jgi:hypothetical protein
MAKAVNRGMVMGDIKLLEKSGGAFLFLKKPPFVT